MASNEETIHWQISLHSILITNNKHHKEILQNELSFTTLIEKQKNC